MGKRNGNTRDRGKSASSGGAGDGARAEQILGGLFDRFTSVDEILRNLDATVSSLNSNVQELAVALDSQTGLDINVTRDSESERPYDYSETVPANTPLTDPETNTFQAPQDGVVNRIVIGWPEGAQQAVGVGVDGTNQESLVPAGPKDAKYIGLNDKVLEFRVNDDVAKGEEYTIRYANNDQSEAHFVNVLVFLKE